MMKTLRLNEEKEYQSPLTTENSNPSLPPPRNKKEILSSLSKESREGRKVAFDFSEERLALPGK